MLVSSLTKIGKAMIGDKDELSILLDEQKKNIRAKKLLDVVIDLDASEIGSLNLSDYQESMIDEYLPGLSAGASRNYSPFCSIKQQKGTNKKFDDFNPSDLVNFDKITLPDDIITDQNSLPFKFNNWLLNNREQLEKRIYDYIKENHLETNKKGEKIISKGAPRFLLFKFRKENEILYPGEIDEFREMYLNLENLSKKGSKKSEALVCLACGIKKDNIISMDKCKFFNLFSIDQASFQLGFSKSYQAMICEDCENFFRNGYNIMDTVLKFEAYKERKSSINIKTVHHSIIPLVESSEKIMMFVQKLESFRKNHYETKQTTLRRKIEELSSKLSDISKQQKQSLVKQIKQSKNIMKFNEDRGILVSSQDIDLLNILQCAKESDIAIMDFYFVEKQVSGNKKKFIEDIIYGSKYRIKQIVDWIEEVDNFFNKTIKFEFGFLVSTFGEKLGRKIIQSLFNSRSISKRDFYKLANNILNPRFRKIITSNYKDVWKERFLFNRDIQIFHFTHQLLFIADILR